MAEVEVGVDSLVRVFEGARDDLFKDLVGDFAG